MKVKEYAQLHHVHPNTVSLWARRGLIECKYALRGSALYICDINPNSKPPQLKPGPRPIEEVEKNLIDGLPPWDQISIDQAIEEIESYGE